MDIITFKLNADSLHFNLVFMPSFQIQCAGEPKLRDCPNTCRLKCRGSVQGLLGPADHYSSALIWQSTQNKQTEIIDFWNFKYFRDIKIKLRNHLLKGPNQRVLFPSATKNSQKWTLNGHHKRYSHKKNFDFEMKIAVVNVVRSMLNRSIIW